MEQNFVFQINGTNFQQISSCFPAGINFGTIRIALLPSAHGCTPFLRGRLRTGRTSNLDLNRQVMWECPAA